MRNQIFASAALTSRKHRILSAVNKIVFFGNNTSYIVLRGCNVTVFNVHAPHEGNVIIQKRVFMRNQRKYHTINLLGDFNKKLGERIFLNQTFGMRVYVRILMISVLE
jgi:hypothetical protein